MAKRKKKIEVVYLEDRTARSLAMFLKKEEACYDARQFAKGKTLKQAWGRCQNSWWLTWYLTRTTFSDKNFGENFRTATEARDTIWHRRRFKNHAMRMRAAAKAFRQYFKVR